MDVDKRFFSAADDRIKRAQETNGTLDAQTLASFAIGGAIKEVAKLIDETVPDGRNKSIALTHLEDVQMRANRGIFAASQEAR